MTRASTPWRFPRLEPNASRLAFMNENGQTAQDRQGDGVQCEFRVGNAANAAPPAFNHPAPILSPHLAPDGNLV
jgi:hypothetical protein